MMRRPFLVALSLVVFCSACADRSAPDETAAAPKPVDPPPPVASAPEPDVDANIRSIGNPSAPDQPRIDPDPPPPTIEPPSTPVVDTLARALTDYAEVLAAIVTPEGLVHYELLAAPHLEAKLTYVVDVLASIELPAVRNEKLALWCNAYNANVLLMALQESRKPGFTNVLGVPGFFDQRTIVVAGQPMTLNGLENDTIRPVGDARIHAALVCAAMSCPPLRAEPFTADRLEDQFDDQSQRWVSDEQKNRAMAGTLRLSEIFNWYGEDFVKTPYTSLTAFLKRHAAPSSSIAGLLRTESNPPIQWLAYDWTLNQAPRERDAGK